MKTLHLQVELSAESADELGEIAATLRVTPDQLVQSLIESYLETREVRDKLLSTRELYTIVSRSSLAQFLNTNQMPKFLNAPGTSADVSYDVDQTALPQWERLLLMQDMGLPMHWMAMLVNITQDATLSSASNNDNRFVHSNLAHALEAVYQRLQNA